MPVKVAAAGNNSILLNNASSYLGGLNDPAGAAPNDGQDLSSYWHSAVQ